MTKEIEVATKKELAVTTPLGELVAVKSSDPANSGIIVFLRLKDKDKTEIDLAVIENSESDGNINIYTYDNVFTEDWQHKFAVKKEDIHALTKELDAVED